MEEPFERHGRLDDRYVKPSADTMVAGFLEYKFRTPSCLYFDCFAKKDWSQVFYIISTYMCLTLSSFSRAAVRVGCALVNGEFWFGRSSRLAPIENKLEVLTTAHQKRTLPQRLHGL